MSQFFCKLFTPWNAERCFASEAQFHAFILGRNKALNTVRVILFAAAMLCLILSYATDIKRWNYVAVAVLVVALVITLLYSKNEKALPEGMREK